MLRGDEIDARTGEPMPDPGEGWRWELCERCGGTGKVEGGTRWCAKLGRSREYADGEPCDRCDRSGYLGPVNLP